MTPLRQRFIEDMQLRGLAPTTQRSYLHYVAEFARYYNTGPEKLDLEAIRQYEIHLLNERKMSPQSVNTFLSSVQFLYLVTLEMPWGKHCFPRVRIASTLPVVLDPEEVAQFFDYVPSLKYRAALMLCYGAGLRISEAVAVRVTDIDSKRMLIRICGRQRTQRSLRHAVAPPAGRAPALLACRPAPRLAVPLLAREPASFGSFVVARMF